MADPIVIVSNIIRFEPSLDRPISELLRTEAGITVVFEEDRRVRLDPSDMRSAGFAQILNGLHEQKMPVYLEIDPEKSLIQRLEIPYITRINSIQPRDSGDLEVELERSHAWHLLSKRSANFKELEQRLRTALEADDMVILTENDAHEIIDVREFRPGPEGLPPRWPKPGPVRPIPWYRKWIRKILDFLLRWFKWLFCCISPGKAQQVFDDMNATSCDPLTVPPPCIPFLYPDDGCWGRAHEMVRLMLKMGLSPKKVWIQGNLTVNTRNNPSCGIHWAWHVAPTLCVRSSGFLKWKDMVIDPSLFTTPVTKATWKGIQGDPNATLTDSDASIFLLGGNQTDPTYAKTNQVLATYRLKLQNRALQYGAPPYAACP